MWLISVPWFLPSETFEDKDGARIEVNYSGPVTVKNTVKDGVIRMAITPMDSAQQDA